MKEKFQSFGKAMLVPITLIAISGLFLGIGSVFTTELTLVSLGVNWDWYAASPLFTFFSVFKGLGEVIIGNLGVLFAVGCAFSLSRKEKGWAAFSALVCYLTMLKTVEILLGAAGLAADNTTVEALQKVGLTSIQASEQSALYTTSLGFFGYSSGVFGGIIVGCLVAWIAGRFYKTKLPTALAFFAGSRTVPIVSLVAGGVLGGIMYFVWPVIGGCFSGIATFVKGSGLVGTFVYRWVLESLVPFGLHPLLETPMYWTGLAAPWSSTERAWWAIALFSLHSSLLPVATSSWLGPSWLAMALTITRCSRASPLLCGLVPSPRTARRLLVF